MVKSGRKPVAAAFPATRPPLMRALNVRDWTNVPNQTLEAWMADEGYPLWFRALAMCARQSFGYQAAEVSDGAALCVRPVSVELGPKLLQGRRPMRGDQKECLLLERLTQRDIAERLQVKPQYVSRAMELLEQRGQVRFEGQKIFMLVKPIPRPAEAESEDAKITDACDLSASEVIHASYKNTLKILKACYFSVLKITDADAPYIRKKETTKEETESEWVGRFLGSVVSALQERIGTAPTHALPSPFLLDQDGRLQQLEDELARKQRRIEELEQKLAKPPAEARPQAIGELEEYLKLFTQSLLKVPDRQLIRKVYERLNGAPVYYLKTKVESRIREGLQVTSYGIFLDLAKQIGEAHAFMQASESQAAPDPETFDENEYWASLSNDSREGLLTMWREWAANPEAANHEMAVRSLAKFAAEVL